MLTLFIISSLLGLLLIWLSHWLRVRKYIKNEDARKMIHFAHALVVAGWPVYAGYWLVIIGELIFLAIVLAAQEYRIFHYVRQINRKTWGEFFFPLGAICLAVIAPPVWVFIVAILLLGLADGAAAIVGTRFKSYHYTIFGHKKSVAGSLAFLCVAALVVLVVFAFTPVSSLELQKFALVLILVPVVATITENISPYGSDNLTIPLVVYMTLLGLKII